MHDAHRHRRRLFLQLDKRLAVRGGDLLGHRGLEHRQRLAELHRPALELAEDGEELLGGALLQLRGHRVGGAAREPLADAQGGAPRSAEGERGEPRGPRDRSVRDHPVVVGHGPIVACHGAGPPPDAGTIASPGDRRQSQDG